MFSKFALGASRLTLYTFIVHTKSKRIVVTLTIQWPSGFGNEIHLNG